MNNSYENNYSNIAKNNILTIISYSIYSNWIKCNQPDCNLNFFSIDIVKHVIPLLSYYKLIYNNFKNKKQWISKFNLLVTEIISKLNK